MTTYHPSADQVGLAASMRDSLMCILPLPRLRESQEESSETWSALRELGVFAISAPEQRGGSGLGALEEALIAVELGRRVASPSVFATIGAAILRSIPGHERVTAGYRRGDRIVFVEDVAAKQVLVRADAGASLFELAPSSRLIDEDLWSCRLREAKELGSIVAAADSSQTLRLRLIDAAALAGTARAALDMAVEHATVREQFGRPIGSFQAVKHHCANMAMATRLACDQVGFAALAIDEQRSDVSLQVESALYVAGSAALECCSTSIQVHGGIGFSEEALPHRLLKRARVLLEIAGGLEASLSRIADCPTTRGSENDG